MRITAQHLNCVKDCIIKMFDSAGCLVSVATEDHSQVVEFRLTVLYKLYPFGGNWNADFELGSFPRLVVTC